MITDAAPPTAPRDAVPALSPRQVTFDVLLAVGCLAVTLAVNLSGAESVTANRDPDAITLALTVLAVGAIALRRRYPLTVLELTLVGVVGLVLVKGTVGMATIGPLIAAYTAVTYASPRNSRRAIALVILALALTAILRPVDLSAEGALISGAAFAGVILLATSTRARREAAEAEVRGAEQRVALERERADAERERAALTATQQRLRITRELHDVIGHAMSVVVVQAGAAGRLLDTADPVRARVAVSEIETTGRQAMTEMRTLLGVLRDGETEGEGAPLAPPPTLTDVSSLVARVGHAGLPAVVEVHGVPSEVPPGVGLAAYRVVQEALTNCLRHSGATCASVDVTYRPNQVEILVADDGSGLGHGRPDPARGHGLSGMRERVAAYGGELATGDRPEGGFRVRATFPLVAKP
ncbi:MAG: sensor histidine kinase [Ornithinibacter sp.]